MFRKFRMGSGEGAGHGPHGYESDVAATDTASRGTVPSIRSISEPGPTQYSGSCHLIDHDQQDSVSSSDTFLVAGAGVTGHTGRNRGTDDPLGLSLVHGTAEYDADIIFVHGLGGSSRRTWSWNRNTDNFWPSWIRHEEGLSHFRVFTYGYNANFKESEASLSILDFSKGLLVRMRTYGQGSAGNDASIGRKPIIFVAHSLGGLVVKKALIIGKNDEYCSLMLSKVHGIMFLSTPHKGSSHAHTLNNFLSIAVGSSSKVYVSELDNSSTSIQDITEQFRGICSPWHLVSLYETLPTKLSPGVKRMIVGKDSGVLNYPKEISSPVDADHHTVCKYFSRLDCNYLLVVDLLRQLTRELSTQTGSRPVKLFDKEEDCTKILETMLGIQGNPRGDLDNQLAQALPGSCQWLYQAESFRHWLDSSGGPHRLLWLTGLPGTGKSILAAKTIDHVQKGLSAPSCQYHFFMETQQTKRSGAFCLRAIAFQLASNFPVLAGRLTQLHRHTGFTPASQKFSVIWDTIFENIIFKFDFGRTLHWILDGIDEADTPRLLVHHFLNMQPHTCIKLLFLSRPKTELTSLVSTNTGASAVDSISIKHTLSDIRAFIASVASEVLPNDGPIKEYVVEKITSKAEGSFLWTKLALDSLRDNWHTEADIDMALNGVPNDMHALYQQMIDAVKNQSPRLKDIAFRVLTWASCGFRSLTTSELEAALNPEFEGFVSLGETAVRICGQFIRVDNDTVSLIHSTARQFLLNSTRDIPAAVGLDAGHYHLATVCLQYLSQDHWRQTLSRVSEDSLPATADRLESLYPSFPLLKYCMNYWAYHVSQASHEASNLIMFLRLFCSKYILQWVQAVALTNNMQNIPRSAQYLKIWLRRRRRKATGNHSPISMDESAFLEEWITDLIRIVGKFGSNLSRNPSTIYRHVPPLCPRGSIIGRTYDRLESPLLSVRGFPVDDWDDNLARLSLGQDEIGSKVRCAGIYILTLISHNGTIIVWHADTCDELRRICHEEWVTLMEVNKTGSLAATSGRYTFRVWDVSSGQQLYAVPKTNQARAMCLNFAKSDTELVLGYDDCSVASYNLKISSEITLFAEDVQDKLRSCPRFMVLSPDLTKVAIAFRGRPVYVWDIVLSPRPDPLVCIRMADKDLQEDRQDVFNSPEVVRWSPNGSLVFILYQDTTIAVWDLVEDEQYEHENTEAREMVLNSDGTCLLTSSNRGSISVWGLPKINLIYRLQSDEFVRDLTFSPDSQRIYDIRGSVCNIWAPDALIRPDELEREEVSSSFDGSFVSEVVSEPVLAEDRSNVRRVTAVACDDEDEFFCCGRDDGSVTIHEIQKGEKVRKVCNHSTTVDIVAIEWSSSRRFIASADDSGKVIAKRLRIKEDGKWAVFPVFDVRVEEAVSQLLFDNTETFLLISTDLMDHVWSLKTKSEVCKKRWNSKTGRKWLGHPSNSSQLIWLDSNQLRIHQWPNLEVEEHEAKATTTHHASQTGTSHTLSLDTDEMVNAIIQPISHQYLLYEIVPVRNLTRSYATRQRRLDLVEIKNLTPESCPSVRKKTVEHLPREMQHLLGSYRGRLVFLDHSNWICTCNIGWDMGSVKRHFFLPRDWINSSTLQPVVLSKQGALLCARKGDIAIIRYSKGL